MNHTPTSPPTIVFTDLYPALYGAQRSLLTLYTRWFREGRYKLHFVYAVEGELSEAIRKVGIPATRIEAKGLFGSYGKRLFRIRPWEWPGLVYGGWSYSWQLSKLLRRENASLLHANGDRAANSNFLGAWLAGVPQVSHVRRDMSLGWYDRLSHTVSTEMIWVSHRVKEDFRTRNHLHNVKGRVIYNGRDLKDADDPSTADAVRGEFSLPANARLALIVASFAERKDHENLVRSAAIACQQVPSLYYLVAGYDTTPGEARRKKIERMIADAGLSTRILLLGHRDDIGRLMRGCDILINPAKYEALGGALIEASCYGLPCVATDAGGTREIVLDGESGFVVPVEDHETLAARTVQLVSDDKLRAAFSQRARVHFRENFSGEMNALNTATFFDEIIARKGR